MRAETILTGGDIRTMDPRRPHATALAIGAGRILATGSDAEIRALAGDGTEAIALRGATVLPGLQDCHLHLQDSGQGFATSAFLDDARDLESFGAAMRDHAAKTGAGWVNGTGWNSGLFDARILDRAALDAMTGDRPCFTLAADAHNACVNSAALAACGVTRDTQDPPNGHIVRDAAGAPTGMLYEDAVSWFRGRMPPVTDAGWTAGVRYGQAHAHAHGITAVLDAWVDERHCRVYNAMDRAGELTLRIAATAKILPEESATGALERVRALRADATGPMFRVHSAKFFLDGVFENRTAAMIAPYGDATGGNAPLMFGPNQIAEMFTAFDAERFQIHVHAIGDGAVRAALDGMEAAAGANGRWPSRHQIAHIQLIDPADVARFRALGAMANIQPLWACHEAAMDDATLPLIGPARAKMVYAFRQLLDAGAEYCLSSDWGVSSLNPFEIMETAITRRPLGDTATPPLGANEALTLEECLWGYTMGAAAAAWRDDVTGSLSPGKWADLCVLDRDPFAAPPSALHKVQVVRTMVAGRNVHLA